MPLPNLDNRASFKNYIRHFKNKFTSQIQDVSLSQIEGILTSKSSGLGDVPVKFVIFDNLDTIDVTQLKNNQNYVYIPGLPGDGITLTLDNQNYHFTFVGNDSGISYNGTTYVLDETINLPNGILTVKGLGGALLQLQNAPTYAITESSTTVNEGDTVTFNITTTEVPDGTLLYYSISGTVSADDFSDNLLQGSVSVSSGSATITKTLANDLSLNATEGQETFTLTLLTGSVNGTTVATSNQITVADTSYASYSSSVVSTNVNEDTTVTVTVNTVGIPDGTVLYYTTSGAASTTYDISTTSGQFTINSNTGSFDIDILQDYQQDDAETLIINIRTGSVTGQIVDTIGPLTITDTAFGMTLTPTATLFDESTLNASSSVTINVTTVNVADNTQFTAHVVTSTSVTAEDFSSLTANFTVVNNAASFSIPITRDGKTEGLETFTIEARNSAGVTVATSPLIGITDRSYIGSRRTGKTFGPIQVNRDNGVVANASDWYNLCNLSNVPDGSKIAIFIDGSGSMTQATIQASLDRLTAELNARQISFIVVTNSNEDWITPFDVPLN